MDFFYQFFGEYSSFAWAVLSHILLAIPLWKMSERTKDEPRWFAWVPVLNGLLALKIAKKPMWWLILFFVPFVNIVMAILLMMALSERFGVNKWWGLLGFITPANIILFYYLAFATDKVVMAEANSSAPKVPDVKPAGGPAPAPPKTEVPDTEAKPPEQPQA